MENKEQILILTSSGQFVAHNTAEINKYLPKPIDKSRIAYITTAANKVADRGYLEIHKKYMDSLGWDYDPIDIVEMTQEELKDKLSKYDIMMVEGGNTFYLLKAIKETGFEKVIKDLIEEGVVYIGSSAGSYVACPSIEMATWTEHGFDRCSITDFTAMNLVPFLIWAHYNKERERILKEKRRELDLEIKTLTDDQALIIQNGKVKLISSQTPN